MGSWESTRKSSLLGLLALLMVDATFEGYAEYIANETNGIMTKEGRYHIPSFMIIGTQKGGTTDLHDQIKRHPLVGMKENWAKELGYFNSQGPFTASEYQRVVVESLKNNVEKSAKLSALAFLNNTHTQELAQEDPAFDPSEQAFLPVATFDATPGYLYQYDVARRIKETLPWLSKFVVTLRNPVDRAYSAYRLRQRIDSDFNLTFEENLNLDLQKMIEAGLVPPDVDLFDTSNGNTEVERSLQSSSFRMPDEFYNSEAELEAWSKYFELKNQRTYDTWGLLTRGLYAIQIRYWFHYFHRDSFLFLKLEDALQSPRGVQERLDIVFDFLGLPRYELTRRSLPRNKRHFLKLSHYVTRHKVSEEIKESTRQRLEALFEPFNEELGAVLGPTWEDPW